MIKYHFQSHVQHKPVTFTFIPLPLAASKTIYVSSDRIPLSMSGFSTPSTTAWLTEKRKLLPRYSKVTFWETVMTCTTSRHWANSFTGTSDEKPKREKTSLNHSFEDSHCSWYRLVVSDRSIFKVIFVYPSQPIFYGKEGTPSLNPEHRVTSHVYELSFCL